MNRWCVRGGVITLPLFFACSNESNPATLPDASSDGAVPADTDLPPEHDDTDLLPTLDESDAGVDASVDGGTDGGVKKGSIIQTEADCDAAHPTWVGGAIVGSDGRALNALIGVDQQDSAGNKIDADGVVCGTAGAKCCGGYSFCISPNPSIGADGTTDPSAVRTWGRCTSAKVTRAFFEIYPKAPNGKTTFTRYGDAVHAYQPIVPSSANTIALRLPQIWQVGNGNTGGVTGRVTCGGKPVAIADITRVRAWSNGKGPECGIEGYNASATSLALAGGVTTYRIDYLAGGRCNAPSQNYRFYMDVLCGGVKKSLRQDADIRQGVDTRLDWSF